MRLPSLEGSQTYDGATGNDQVHESASVDVSLFGYIHMKIVNRFGQLGDYCPTSRAETRTGIPASLLGSTPREIDHLSQISSQVSASSAMILPRWPASAPTACPGAHIC